MNCAAHRIFLPVPKRNERLQGPNIRGGQMPSGTKCMVTKEDPIIFGDQMSVGTKFPWGPNVYGGQMSMGAKYLREPNVWGPYVCGDQQSVDQILHSGPDQILSNCINIGQNTRPQSHAGIIEPQKHQIPEGLSMRGLKVLGPKCPHGNTFIV